MELAILVRPAVDADLPAILNLYAHLNPEDPALEISHAQAVWTEILKSNRVTPLVATAGRAPVATCLLVIVPNLTRGGRPFGLIENVVTVPRFRRRGIGNVYTETCGGIGLERQLLQSRADDPPGLR